MSPEIQPNTLFPPDAAPSSVTPTDSPDWNEHEHVSGQVQLQAQKLVNLSGSPELAKYAIGVVEQSQTDSSSNAASTDSPISVKRWKPSKHRSKRP
jgi:hypothetical protein